jgi:hypothetical protein
MRTSFPGQHNGQNTGHALGQKIVIGWARLSRSQRMEPIDESRTRARGFAVVYFLSKKIAYSNFGTAKTPANASAPAPARADAKPKQPMLSSGTGFLVHPDGLLIAKSASWNNAHAQGDFRLTHPLLINSVNWLVAPFCLRP